MQKEYIGRIRDGAVVAEDVYDADGVLLMKRGGRFRAQFIPRFIEAGVQEIVVEDGHLSETTVEAVRDALQIEDIIRERIRNQAIQQVKKSMLRYKNITKRDIQSLVGYVEEMIQELLEHKDFVLALSHIRAVDDYTYGHSVNVGVLALMVGIDLGLSKRQLKCLGTGAIMHDIGKIKIPDSILKKPGKLTHEEYEQVKLHTEYGYEMLIQTDLPQEVAEIARHHHEKYDGTGYAHGISGADIPLFARIVAVADVYDAMSNDRIYKRRYTHSRVFCELLSERGKQFDSEIMDCFLNHIYRYPLGTGVVLNTGHRGIVISLNPHLPESPVVRIFFTGKNHMGKRYADIDLAQRQKWYIVSAF